MINSGMGEQQTNNLLTGLNIPEISHTTLKRREREISSSFIEVAEKSCKKAVTEELRLLDEINRYVCCFLITE